MCVSHDEETFVTSKVNGLEVHFYSDFLLLSFL